MLLYTTNTLGLIGFEPIFLTPKASVITKLYHNPMPFTGLEPVPRFLRTDFKSIVSAIPPKRPGCSEIRTHETNVICFQNKRFNHSAIHPSRRREDLNLHLKFWKLLLYQIKLRLLYFYSKCKPVSSTTCYLFICCKNIQKFTLKLVDFLEPKQPLCGIRTRNAWFLKPMCIPFHQKGQITYGRIRTHILLIMS